MTAYTDQEFLVDILSDALSVPVPPRQGPDKWGDQMRTNVLDILEAATAKTQPPQVYAMELVTESVAEPIMPALHLAMDRLAQDSTPDLAARWAVGLCFSVAARQEFCRYATAPGSCALWGEDASNGVGAIIITVPEAPPGPPGPPGAQKEGCFMPGLLAPTPGLVTWNPPSTAGALGLAADVVRDFGASGSQATTKGSVNAGSTALQLDQPLDFRLEQGIVVAGAGPNAGPLVTTVIGGAGTSRLTLADAAASAVTGALIQHEDSWAWQAAIDTAVAPAVITCPPGSSLNLAAPLRLKSGVVLNFPASTLTWIGAAGGFIFTSPEGQLLSGAGITGGTVDPGAAGRVIELHGPQECLIDLEVLDGADGLTVMRWVAEAGSGTQPGPRDAAGNVVRRLIAGKCDTLLSLSGQEGAAVTGNLFQRLAGRGCRTAGIVCEATGYVDTNVFLDTSLTLTADSSVGVDLGAVDTAPAIMNQLFVALTVSNPDKHVCTGLYLRDAAQVQVLAYYHSGLAPGTSLNTGQSASYYIRDMALEDSDRLMQDTTKGWSVTPLQIGQHGTPISNHVSSYQTVKLPPVIPAMTPLTTSVNVDGAAPGDTVIATPDKPVPPGLVWNCFVGAPGQATLNLCNVTPADLALVPDTKWRFDIWQH